MQAEDSDHLVANELVEHAACVQDCVAGERVILGEAAPDVPGVPCVADEARVRAEVGHHYDDLVIGPRLEDLRGPEALVAVQAAQLPRAEMPEQRGGTRVVGELAVEGDAPLRPLDRRPHVQQARPRDVGDLVLERRPDPRQ